MNTLDDLRAAFTRLEDLTPLEVRTLPVIRPDGTRVHLVTDASGHPHRRLAIIGAGVGVAATIATVTFVTTSQPGSDSNHLPVGTSPTTATSATSDPSAAPTSASSTAPVAPASSAVPDCPTGSYNPQVCGTSASTVPSTAVSPDLTSTQPTSAGSVPSPTPTH